MANLDDNLAIIPSQLPFDPNQLPTQDTYAQTLPQVFFIGNNIPPMPTDIEPPTEEAYLTTKEKAKHVAQQIFTTVAGTIVKFFLLSLAAHLIVPLVVPPFYVGLIVALPTLIVGAFISMLVIGKILATKNLKSSQLDSIQKLAHLLHFIANIPLSAYLLITIFSLSAIATLKLLLLVILVDIAAGLAIVGVIVLVGVIILAIREAIKKPSNQT